MIVFGSCFDLLEAKTYLFKASRYKKTINVLKRLYQRNSKSEFLIRFIFSNLSVLRK